MIAIQINRTDAGDVSGVPTPVRGEGTSLWDPVAELAAERAGHRARLALEPTLPDLSCLNDGQVEDGRWYVEIDGIRLTGGSWSLTRAAERVDLALEVDERWRPGRLPWLMRLVTTVVPVFRRWPTTYRWRGEVNAPSMTSRWERTASDVAASYRRATDRS